MTSIVIGIIATHLYRLQLLTPDKLTGNYNFFEIKSRFVSEKVSWPNVILKRILKIMIYLQKKSTNNLYENVSNV